MIFNREELKVSAGVSTVFTTLFTTNLGEFGGGGRRAAATEETKSTGWLTKTSEKLKNEEKRSKDGTTNKKNLD